MSASGSRTIRVWFPLCAAVAVGGGVVLYQCCLRDLVSDYRLVRATVTNINAELQDSLVSVIREHPFAPEKIAPAMALMPGWDRVLICGPYCRSSEFANVGISTSDLCAQLEWVSNTKEEWHVFLLNRADKIAAHGSISLPMEERPHARVIVLRRDGGTTRSTS